ncbi:hypothetical protein LCDVSa143R [Lymphocystis disease virus 3]|uniref:Fibronectin type-III domain-containing protein n=1 Tax=Lymphocystis disease virus 3 TaxID=2560566 RepID=A0A1B2RW62_9VIRU|nr:hypothetical protein BZK12_gp143 [Lymphocystis disease virus Sa]AOC55227.1 hypothetical protein LCDVSa143R [Lymphocystis disease virus 3]
MIVIYILSICLTIDLTEAVNLVNLDPFRWQINFPVVENCTTIYKTIEGEQSNPVVVLYSTDRRIEVKTTCQNKSDSVFFTVPRVEMIQSVGCFVTTGQNGYCSWSVIKDVKNLTFSYAFDKNFTTILCSVGQESECFLQLYASQVVYILFKGVVKGKPVVNVFKTVVKARPPPIELTINKNITTFDLRWKMPDIKSLNDWKFIISYTECGKSKIEVVRGKTAVKINRISCCRYCLSVMGETDDDDRTSWNEETCFNPPIAVLTVIGFLIAAFAILVSVILTYFLIRKGKEDKTESYEYESEV